MSMRHFDAATTRWTGRCVDAAQRHARAVVAGSLLLAAAALAFAATHLGVNSNTDDLLSNELPHRRNLAAFARHFGDSGLDLVVVVEGATAGLTHDAASALFERLAADAEHFAKVVAPGSGDFFDRHGLLYLDVDELEQLADHLAKAQPFLAELARDPSLARLLELLAFAVRHGTLGGVSEDGLGELLERVAFELEQPLDGWAPPLAWDDWMMGAVANGGPMRNRRVIFATPRVDYEDFEPAKTALARVHELARAAGLSAEHGVRVRVTGDLALSTEELSNVRGQAVAQLAGSFLAVTLLLLIALRSGRLVLHASVTLLVGLAWTTGFAALAIGHLNVLSTAFAVLFIGLAIDYGIHFLLRWLELRDAGHDVAGALGEAGRSVGTSLLLCALTTALGFYSFVPTGFVGIAELGVIVGSGLILSLFATLTLLPALVRLWPPPEPGRRRGLRAITIRLPDLPMRRPRTVCAAAALVALGALALAPALRFDGDPLNVRDPSTESVQAMRDLVRGRRPSPWSAELLAPDLASAQALAERLEALPGVEHAVTLASFVPEDQEDKLAILEDVRLFLPSLAPPAEPPPADPARTQAALDGLRAALRERRVAERGTPLGHALDTLLTAAEHALVRIGADPESAADVAKLEQRLLGDLRGWLRRLDLLLQAGPVTLDTLPESLRAQYLAPDGSARVEVFASEDLSQPGRMEAFADAVLAVDAHATGAAITIVESARAIEASTARALLYATAAIACLLLVLWRNLADTLLAMAPLAFASLTTAAAAVLLGLPLNYADVIVLPLLLGMGVDSGIHLVHRFRHEPPDRAGVLHTSTARAVLFSALTTLASFGSLGFSSHRGMASLGQLLALGMTMMLVANLIVLPALLAWVGRPGAALAQRAER